MQVVDEQVNRMTAIVDHQLRRATAQVTQTLAHNMLDLTPLVQRLINAMHKGLSAQRHSMHQPFAAAA